MDPGAGDGHSDTHSRPGLAWFARRVARISDCRLKPGVTFTKRPGHGFDLLTAYLPAHFHVYSTCPLAPPGAKRYQMFLHGGGGATNEE